MCEFVLLLKLSSRLLLLLLSLLLLHLLPLYCYVQVRFGPWAMADGESPNVGAAADCALLKAGGYTWIYDKVRPSDLTMGCQPAIEQPVRR